MVPYVHAVCSASATHHVGQRRVLMLLCKCMNTPWGRLENEPRCIERASVGLQVRTQTLVKNAIVEVDAVPFRQWYQQHYGTEVGLKKKTAAGAAAAAEEAKEVRGCEQGLARWFPILPLEVVGLSKVSFVASMYCRLVA